MQRLSSMVTQLLTETPSHTQDLRPQLLQRVDMRNVHLNNHSEPFIKEQLKALSIMLPNALK